MEGKRSRSLKVGEQASPEEKLCEHELSSQAVSRIPSCSGETYSCSVK